MLRLILPLTLLLAATQSAAADPSITIGSLRFLGATNVPNEAEVDGTLVGGLSGIDYDPVSQEWAIISDDKSDHAPARFYLARFQIHEDFHFPGLKAIAARVAAHQVRDQAPEPIEH